MSKTTNLARAAKNLTKRHSTHSAIWQKAIKALDTEAVSSAVGIVGAHYAQVQAINADADLSDTGKRARIQSSASTRLGNIGTLAKKLAALEAEHRQTRATAVPLEKPSDPWEVALDFEIARQVKADGLQPFHLTPAGIGELDRRTRETLARVPAVLTGLTEAQRAKFHGSLISPALAVELAEDAEALQAAREVVQAAIDELGTDADWSAGELVEHIGPEWNLPGVAQSRADRMAAGGPEHAGEALGETQPEVAMTE